MPEMTVDFDIVCAECGDDLSVKSKAKDGPYIKVYPCDRCLSEKYQEGYEKGIEDTEP